MADCHHVAHRVHPGEERELRVVPAEPVLLLVFRQALVLAGARRQEHGHPDVRSAAKVALRAGVEKALELPGVAPLAVWLSALPAGDSG